MVPLTPYNTGPERNQISFATKVAIKAQPKVDQSAQCRYTILTFFTNLLQEQSVQKMSVYNWLGHYRIINFKIMVLLLCRCIRSNPKINSQLSDHDRPLKTGFIFYALTGWGSLTFKVGFSLLSSKKRSFLQEKDRKIINYLFVELIWTMLSGV